MVAVAQQTYTPLNAPLISQQEIIDALRVTVPTQWNVPIYDEFPSEVEKVRFGLYVSDVWTAERSVNKLGVQFCGAYYDAVDQFTVTYVSFQQDPHETGVNDIIANLVTLNVAGMQLMDGYFSRTFSHELSYGPTRAAIHTYTFRVTRLEFNT